MSRFRHSLSFLMTTIVYIFLAFSYIYIIKINKPLIKKENINRIKISLINPTPKPTIKPTPKPIIHAPTILSTPKPKKIVRIRKTNKIKPKKRVRIKKKRKIKHKKVVKKQIVKRRKFKPKIRPTQIPIVKAEPIVEDYIYEPQIVSTPKPKIITPKTHYITSPTPIKMVQKVADGNLENEKNRFLKKIRANIYNNKHYPLKAKRRRLEGSVHILFDIDKNGEAVNIRTSNAPSILQQSAKISLKKSFPVSIPDNLINKFPMRNISINMDFRLR